MSAPAQSTEPRIHSRPAFLGPGGEPVRFAIVADDLTGACDAGVHFLRLGWDVFVTLDPRSLPAHNGLSVIATHTRNETPDAASETVRQCATSLAASGRTLLYKKMDSTLHGHPGAEIDALLDVFPFRGALICPAFPEMGRRFRQGELFLGEEPRSTTRNLVTRLRAQSVRRVVHLTVESLRSASALHRVQSEVQRESVLIACDAETEDDLTRVAELAREFHPGLLPCGSTGLARQLAAVFDASVGPNRESQRRRPRPAGPCVGVIGSTSSVTQEQIRHAVTHRQVRTVALRDLDATKLEAALKQPRPLILTLRLDSSDPARLSMLVDHLQRSHPCGLLLSGGDTARLFCQFAEIQELRLAGEVETGFPWATVPEGRFAGMVLATKAGGFGKVDSLSRWIDWISQGTSGSRCE